MSGVVRYRKVRSPQEARTFDQVFDLKTDNMDTKEAWILTDGPTVTISTQRAGESATGKVTLSKRDFDRMVRWYLTPTTCRKFPKTQLAEVVGRGEGENG